MAFPIPNPPTDNLYKFWALSSALLSIFFFYQALEWDDKLQKETWELSAQLNHLEALTQLLPSKRDIGSPNDEADTAFSFKFQKRSLWPASHIQNYRLALLMLKNGHLA